MLDTPTKEDISISKDLAERLKGKTHAETLNNILEWQERNITYWQERSSLNSAYNLILFLSYILCVIYQVYLIAPLTLRLQPSTINLDTNILLCLLGIILVPGLLLSSKLSVEMDIAIRLFCTALLFYLIMTLSNSADLFLSILNLFLLISSGIPPFIMLYLFFVYYTSFVGQKINLISKLRKTCELITMTLKYSLPLVKMLEHRKGICRDYAKLTIALLMNLYQNKDVHIYLLTTQTHVATGIKISNRTYVLDQELPVFGLEAWLTLRGIRKVNIVELIRKESNEIEIRHGGEIINNKPHLKTFNLRAIFKDVINEVIKAIDEKRDSTDIILRNVALLFDVDDEVVRESLMRKIRIVLQNELVSKASKVKDMQILKKDTDIVLRIQLANTA